MNAQLENRLSALSLTDKIEVDTSFMPLVTLGFNEKGISHRLLAELERRHHQHRANPETGLSFEDFKGHWSHPAHS
jgi:hypothetical protein